jgi:zinc/manganese transport system substrate-binding protein
MQAQRSMGYGLCFLLTALLALSGCTGVVAERPLIVATSTIVGGLASEVAGNGANVEVLVPIGADPSTYEPTSLQAGRLLEADLIVTSGLDLENGLAEALADAEHSGIPVLRLGDELDPRLVSEGNPDQFDPYWWMDPLRAAGAIQLIADRMSVVCVGDWAWRALEAESSCYDLDDQIRSVLHHYGSEQPRIVVNEAGLGYFAERYDFDVTPAAREPIETFDLHSVTQILTESNALPSDGVSWVVVPESTIGDGSVVDVSVVPRDLGAPTVTLFVDSLGAPGSGAETYQNMMLTNAERIAEAGPVSFVERAHGGV